MPNNDMNVTLHFNYEQDAASYSKVMSALDQMQKKGVETLKAQNMSDTQINEYINGFTKMKNAIESSFSPDLTTFSVGYASQLKEFQEGYATVQKYTDGAKVSIDNMGESFDSGALKIDKYSDKLDHFKLTLANAFRYNIVNRAIDMITNSIRDMINYVIELDSALNSIRIITGKSSDEMLQFAAANQESAKELGRTATEYAQASLIFYQQGLDDSQVKGRTDAALKLANVTGQSVQEIVNQMTAIWNNFDDGSHNLEYYEDVITALGATTASSSKEIAAGLEKFAAIGDTVGLSYEYAASALATVVATTRQSEDVVGTAFKTMFARLQSLKLGETLDDGTTLTKYTQALESIGVSVLDQNGNLKDMDVILDEIGAKWQTLDRNQQTALANTVGGVRQYAQFIALFDNFDFFKENVTTALESAGTVTQQNTIYMESYEAKIKQIKATLDSIKFDMFMGQDFGGLLDFADSFLVSLRTIIHDFGGFNQILTVTGALLAQMFLPQIIQRFSQEFMKLKTQMDSMSNMNFGEKLKEIFSPKAGFKDINSVFTGLLGNYQNFENKTELVKRAQHDLGEEAGTSLGKLIDKYQEAAAEADSFKNKVSQMDYSYALQRMQEQVIDTDLFSDDVKQALVDGMSKLTIPDEAIGSTEKYYEFIEKIKQQIPALKDINLDFLDGAKIEAEANRAKTALEQFKKQWESLSTMGQITKLASAGAVAFRGLASAFEKFQEGDLLGGVAGGLTSIGSALMMIPGAQLVGGILTAAGTVTSVIKSQIEKAEKEAKETLDNYIETKKKYEDTISSLDELSKKYNRLSSKSSLTVDEQNELNNALEEMQKIMSEDGTYNLIAYYDEYGNAVYKTIDVINEYVEALKEKQRAELEDKKQEAEEAKNKVIKKDSTIQKYENYRDAIKEYNNIIDAIKTNNWSFEDIQKNTNVDWSQLGISTVSGVISYYEGYISRAETEVERIGNEFSSKIKDYWKNQFDYEIGIPLDEIKLNIDDKNGRLFIDQLKSKINNAVQNEEINLDTINISSLTEGLSEFQNWEGLLQGDVNAFAQLKQILGENNPLLALCTELINENKNALQQHEVMVNSLSSSFNELANSINEGTEHWNTIDEAYKELNETGLVTTETIAKIAEEFADFDGIDDVVESLLAGTMSLQEFNDISDEWFNDYIQNLDILKNVTYENENEVISILEKRYGVTNAAAVVQDQLNQREAEGAIASKNLTDKLAQYGISASAFISWCQQQGISLYEVETDARFAQSAINDYQSAVASGSGDFDVSKIISKLDEVIRKADEARNSLSGLGALAASFTGTVFRGLRDALIKVRDAAKKNNSGTTAERTKPTSPGGGGGGGGGGGSGGEPYEAQLTGWEKVEDELTIIENKIKRIQEEEKNTDDIEEKIKLRKQESELLEEKKNKLHELNDLQRKQIDENIETLRNNGFDVYYDADAQELIVNNREHLHDLNDTLEKDMETMIKDTYSLVNVTRKNSDEWREANKIIKDTDKEIQKLIEQQHKEEMNAFNDKISDKLFYTAFYEGLQSGLPTLKNIYLDVINSLYEQLNKLYQEGYTDADDDVQKIWKEILKYQKEVDEIDNDLFNNQIKYIDRILDLIPEIPETYDERMELVQKKVELRNERINELMVKGTESALDEVMSLYEQNAKDIEAMYKLMIGKIKDQQDELKDAIDGVVILIDEEIDKLKEEQETQKKINEEKEKEIELLKLKANLEAAQQQKTVQVYRKGQGFVWEANRKAIKDAEKALNDFNSKNEKDELQEKIDALEEYKKSWSSIPQTIEDEQKKEAALLKFGADGLKEILEMRGNYQKDALKEYRFFAEQINSLTNQMNEDLETVKDQMEDVKDQQEDFINNPEMNIAEAHKIWYADSNGMAPEGAKIGDVIITAGGNRLITPEDFEGAIKSGLSGLSSILITDLVPYLYNPEKAGTEITDSSLKEQVFSDLEEIITSFSEDTLPETTNAINDNTTNLGTMDKTIEILNTNLGIYTSAMTNAVYHGQDLVKAAGIYSSRASASADESSMYADMSYNYYKLTKDLYDRMQEQEPPEGSQNHKGIEMGPIGSEAGKQAFDSNLTRIARGDIKDDEMWALLQKGEAVFTPEQLDNMVGALNYSLDSVDKLSSLNSKMFTLGQMSNINVAPNTSNLRPISFGDINIQMHGVNDLDTFSIVLKNNVKSIFAQTLAKE